MHGQRRMDRGWILGRLHPSGLYDEKFRAFEPFYIQGAISEIILGSRFYASSSYWKFLEKNYKINQA
jgi:hypothetical protein